MHLPDDHHDYGYTKRVPMYRFFAKVFGLNLKAITAKDGTIDESKITIEKSNAMLMFDKDFPLPANARKSHKEIVHAFEEVQASDFK